MLLCFVILNEALHLYSTFTPQVARMVPPRPVTADDLERDHVLEQRISLFKWIEPYHLDIPDKHGREGFLMFAQQGLPSYTPSTPQICRPISYNHPFVELLKVNHYKAPRDKLICILNCCKVIFGPPSYLRGSHISTFD